MSQLKLTAPADKDSPAAAAANAADWTAIKAHDNDELPDKVINCVDCRENFVWTSGEQTFFRDKGLQNAPKRCKTCKQQKTERLNSILAAQATGIRQRVEVSVKCAQCDETTTVPFYPSQGRPVYCRSCFLQMQTDTSPATNNGNLQVH